MAENHPLYLGPRLKRLRRELGLTQQTMGEDLGISPSYVALLERNQRPLTAGLLLRLASTYKLDMTELAQEQGGSYSQRLSEALRDPIFADIDLPTMEVADVAANFPGITEALLRLHSAYLREQQALVQQRSAGNTQQGVDPIAEAQQFIARQRNYFHDLDSKAESLAAEIVSTGGTQAWLSAQGTRVRFLPPDVLMGSIRRYDRHNDQLLISDSLDGASRAYQLALHCAYIGLRPELNDILRQANLTSETAKMLVRRALAGYGAAAMLMPYTQFADAVEARHYDVEALSRQFGTSFEQTAHRLTTLSRPGAERVPFFFLRIDAAGNVSKRLDGAGFHFAAYGGGCPLWNVYSTFRTRGELATQWLELPDGARFFSIARTVSAGGGRFGHARIDRAIALACAAEHAPKLIYAAGLDPAKAEATPIGVTCTLCHRSRCAARALPPIGREILPEDYMRGAEPFTFAEG